MVITNIEINNNIDVLPEGSKLKLILEAERVKERKIYKKRFGKLDNANKELINAVLNGDELKVSTLVKNGANIETRNEYGYTILMLAALNNYEEITEFLLKSGANECARNEGMTALLFARHMRHYSLAFILSRSIRKGLKN